MTLPAGIIRTAGGQYVLAEDSHLSRWIEQEGRLSIAERQIAHYAKHIPPGGTVLDAGACLGDHTATYARLVGGKGRVLALEPNPLTFKALKLNFDDVPNVTTINVGLGERIGAARMHHAPNVGASFVGETGDVPVVIVTIDSLSLQELHFLHLDLEGFEIAALRGARETIKRLKPVMVLEVCHGHLARNGGSEAELRALLAEFGYTVQETHPDYGPGMEQRDILAVPSP